MGVEAERSHPLFSGSPERPEAGGTAGGYLPGVVAVEKLALDRSLAVLAGRFFSALNPI
jgi:hypothetical protein